MTVIIYDNDCFANNTLHFMWAYYTIGQLQNVVIGRLYHANTVERVEL
jgi:hypothetical protein